MHTKGVLSFYMTLYKYQVKHTLMYVYICIYIKYAYFALSYFAESLCLPFHI